VDYTFIRPQLQVGTSSKMIIVGTAGNPYVLSNYPNRNKILLMLDATGGKQTIGAAGGSWDDTVKPMCVNTDDSKIRHSGGANMLFGDFHVEYKKWGTVKDPDAISNPANQAAWSTITVPY
jgi:prepilin-type processing-associated H-X9-DG protein